MTTRPSSGAEPARVSPPAQRRGRRWRAVWALLILDVVAAPSLYQLWRDARGDVAEAAPRVCVGDCDQDSVVGEGELLTGIAIALADVPLDTCKSFDVVEGGRVTVDELVRAVVDSLGPCRFALPTVTSTLVTTPFTPHARPRATPPPP
jgi:hypothetical protein